MRQSQVLASLLTTSWLALLSAVFIVLRPELSYSYGHWLGELTGNLPRLTEALALPVLGPSISTASQLHDLPFWLVWGGIFLPPLAFLRGIWLTRERTALLEYVIYRGALYLIAVVAVATFVALGLWLPFSAA